MSANNQNKSKAIHDMCANKQNESKAIHMCANI